MHNFIGVETGKAVDNWGMELTPPVLVKAYAQVKKSALLAVNDVCPSLSKDVFNRTMTIIDEIIHGRHNHLFILPLKQGGAGTSLNMNMNEVISYLVNLESDGDSIDYLEDVNRFQSTNDTFNTAVTIIFLQDLTDIEQMVIELQEILVEKEMSYSDLLITGRTEMMSALPITLGQVFASYAGSIERDRWRFNKVKERVRSSVLGGTAMGTCFNAPSKYLFAAEKFLRSVTGLSISRSQNLTSDISMCDKFVEAGSVFNLLSNTLYKMASDFTQYSAWGEFTHPEMQYGSSIMPMKTNPVLLEFIRGLAIDISLEVRKIDEYSKNGQLQLNAFLPFILSAEISIVKSLKKAMESMLIYLSNFSPDRGVIESNLLNSGAMVNSLRPYCSYEQLKELSVIVKREHPKDIEDLKEIFTEHSHLDREFLDEYLTPGGFTSFLRAGHSKELLANASVAGHSKELLANASVAGHSKELLANTTEEIL